MKKIRIYGAALIFFAAALGAGAQTVPTAEDKLFQEIKLLVFDEKWTDALSKIDEFQSAYPLSPFSSLAVYYKSKCLKEQTGREKEALRSYKSYIQVKDKNKNLAEDAEVSVIDLALKLYEKGDKEYVREIEDRLAGPNKIIKYYAAIQLSYVKDKRISEKSVPVLKQIVEEEESADLRDRAKIALMRVSPDALAGLTEEKPLKKAGAFHLMILDDRTKKVEFQLNIPWAFADLALAAIPEEAKRTMRLKGYDINGIITKLQSAGGNILEINDAKEGKTIKIWID